MTEPAHWVVAYDFASQWFNPWDWIPALAGLIVAFVGMLIVRGREHWGHAIAGVAVVVAGGWLAVTYAIEWVETCRQLSRAYHERTYEVAEGVVEHFQSVCDSHHGESFDVSGVKFAYADGVIHQGFRQTICWSGPMRGGLYVRIWHVTLPPGGQHYILRIEIRRP